MKNSKTAPKRKGAVPGGSTSPRKASSPKGKPAKSSSGLSPKKSPSAPKKAAPAKPVAKPVAKKFVKSVKTPVKHPAVIKAHAIARQKRVVEGTWLAKPWSVDRIRGFMGTWGMTQAEFAIFCGVSYDTVTSWSRGRRNLVRVDHAEHIESAEKAAAKRKLPRRDGNESVAPWADLRTFVRRRSPGKRFKNIPSDIQGAFTVVGVEMNPDEIRLAEPIETVVIGKPTSKKGSIPVTIVANNLEITLDGRWRELGGARLLELLAPVEDPHFFSGHAGCIIPGKQNLRINLWPTDKKIPMRLIAVKK